MLAAPERGEAYANLAGLPCGAAAVSAKADLIVRWMAIGGFRKPDLQRLASSAEIYETRHYVALMTAVRSRWAGALPNAHLYERRIVEQPPASDTSRKVALQNLAGEAVQIDRVPVLVAAMPKSASTFLCSLLADVLGRSMVTPHNRNDPTGVSFDMQAFLGACRSGAVIHSHLDANARAMAMVRLLGLRAIVQTRNIFDALASYAEHLAHRRYPGSSFADLPPAQARKVAILRMARHYVDLFASWKSAPSDIPLTWVDYDDVRRDPVSTVQRVLAGLGLPVDRARIEARLPEAGVAGLDATQGRRLRINRAIPGRGATFSAEEKAWVRTLYAEYPGVDFSPIDPRSALDG